MPDPHGITPLDTACREEVCCMCATNVAALQRCCPFAGRSAVHRAVSAATGSVGELARRLHCSGMSLQRTPNSTKQHL